MRAADGRALSAVLLDAGGDARAPEWERQVPERLLRFMASLPPSVRTGLHAADVALDGFSVLTTGRRAHRLPADARARLLRRLVRLPGLEGLLDTVKIPLLLAAGASRHSARAVRPLVRTDPPLDLCPSSGWPDAARVDAVVIGSGAGGAVAALTLAASGRSVVVLEEGRHFPTRELASRPPLDRFADAYRDGGATLAWGLPPVLLPLGRAVGGTTLVNSGTCFRTPDDVLRRWHRTHGVELADPAAFARHLDHVESLLGVDVPDPSVLGRNGGLALSGSERLGWSAAPLRRNATGCGGCCECVAGCPSGAKQAVHLSVLPAACAAGARIVTRARATRILTEHRAGARRAVGVEALRPDGTAFTLGTELVVVAAGALHTPALLRRSGLAGHPRLGRNLAIHPAVSVAGRFTEAVTGPGAGPNVLQSVGVDEWHHDGILIEATAAPPGMTSFVLPHLGAGLKRELAEAGKLGLLGAMVSDRPSGRVRGAHRPVASYALHAEDGDRLLRSMVHMGRILFAAGAREVLTGIASDPSVTSPGALEEVVRRTGRRRLHLSAFHPTGTAALGADGGRSPRPPRREAARHGRGAGLRRLPAAVVARREPPGHHHGPGPRGGRTDRRPRRVAPPREPLRTFVYSPRGRRGAAGRTTTRDPLRDHSRKRGTDSVPSERGVIDMQTLANFTDGGPGPWILLFPLIWALVIGGGIALLRRTAWRGGPRRRQDAVGGDSPIAVLGHRFASGEIDEDEYWRRLSVLNEEFGRKGGGA